MYLAFPNTLVRCLYVRLGRSTPSLPQLLADDACPAAGKALSPILTGYGISMSSSMKPIQRWLCTVPFPSCMRIDQEAQSRSSP